MGSSEFKKVLSQTEHRPYPLPEGSWVLRMSWHHLLFVHWPVPEDVLRLLIPPALELDTFEEPAWLGVVSFCMESVWPRFLPALRRLSSFPQLNLHTYATHEGKPGIWFFSLDAHNPVAVCLARATFGLPYFDADMHCQARSDEVRYRSVRQHEDAPPARFAASYRLGSLENFLTERYCLYSTGVGGSGPVVRRGDIHHRMWSLQSAEVEAEELEMTARIMVMLPDV
jgi:uncharacterized protein YqjF (DUF2071 family)